MELLSSPRVCVGSLWVHLLSPTVDGKFIQTALRDGGVSARPHAETMNGLWDSALAIGTRKDVDHRRRSPG